MVKAVRQIQMVCHTVPAIISGLKQILADVENGNLEITSEYEDIHSFVEANLIRLTGDVGKKLHTGRSRNDQVALDMKLYVRDEIDELDSLLMTLQSTLLDLMEKHTETFMPGFTHLQKAQPLTLAHHLGAYFEMLRRDRERLADTRKRLNLCPLGSGALAGTTYPLDREYTASLLGFDGATRNSMDSVSDRDYLIETLLHFDKRIQKMRQDTDHLSDAMSRIMRYRISEALNVQEETRRKLLQSIRFEDERKNLELKRYDTLLNAYSPLNTLSRGYALVFQNGKVVRKSVELDQQEDIAIRFSDGEVTAAVKETK